MSEPTVHEDVHALLGAYALDALDDDERAAYERHLPTCADCTEQLPGLRAAVARLGSTADVTPPAHLKSSVLQAVGRTRQLPPVPAVSSLDAARQRRFGSRLLSAAAALLLVIAGGLGVAAGLEHRNASNATDQVTAIERLLTNPEHTQQTAVPGGGTAELHTAGKTALVVMRGAAAPPAGKSYEVWVVSKQKRASKLKVMDKGDGEAYVADTTGVSQLAVTLEPAGGSPQPTSEPFLTFTV